MNITYPSEALNKCIICNLPIELKIDNHNYQLIECDEYEMDKRHTTHIAHLICSRKIEADEICSWTLD